MVIKGPPLAPPMVGIVHYKLQGKVAEHSNKQTSFQHLLINQLLLVKLVLKAFNTFQLLNWSFKALNKLYLNKSHKLVMNFKGPAALIR